MSGLSRLRAEPVREYHSSLMMYVSREMLLRVTHSVGEAETIWIQTVRHDQAGEVAAALDLRRLYNERKLDVNSLGIFPKDTSTEGLV